MDGLRPGIPAPWRPHLLHPADGPVAAATSLARATHRRRARPRAPTLALALVTAGCFNESRLIPAVDRPTSGTDTDGDTSAGETAASTTTGGGSASGAPGLDLGDATPPDVGAATTTSADDTAPDAPAPTIDTFAATPSKVEHAGPLIFTLACSEDVVEVELREETLGTIATLTPAEFPYEHFIASDAQNDHGHFSVIARDAEGAIASASTSVTIAVPTGGLEVWTTPPPKLASEAYAAVPYEGGAVAVGYRLDGIYLRAEVTRLDDQGAPMWTIIPELSPGYATGVAVDGHGNLIVVGNRHVKDYQAMWIRTYDPEGVELPETAIFGAYGERALAIASAPSGGYYVVGDVREPGSNSRDLRFYGHVPVAFTKTWAGPEIPDAPAPDDQAFALAVLDDGDVAVVGSTQLLEKDDDDWIARPRTIVLRYTASGSYLGHWIDDDEPHRESQARSAAPDREGGILVGGRTGPRLDGYGDDAYPVVYRLGPDLEPIWERIIPGGDPAACVSGVARSFAGDIVVAATVTGTDIFLGELDGQVGSGMESWSWKRTFDVQGLADRVNTLALGPYGELLLAGQATYVGDGPRSFVRLCTP